MFYIVVEVQYSDGVPVVMSQAFETIEEALARYYAVLSVAAVSNIDKHGAFLLSHTGRLVKSEIFNREETENPNDYEEEIIEEPTDMMEDE